MQADYFERLSTPVRELVLRVEEGAGVDFKIKLDASRAGRGPDGMGILACDIDEFGATLLIPSADYFPDGAVVHEVLHARRVLVEGVPKLADNPQWELWTPQFANTLVHVDNALEHMLIVPEEIERSPDRVQHWTAVMERVWGGELQSLADEADRRRWALLHWPFVQLVLTGSRVSQQAAAVLHDFALEDAANEFLACVRPVLARKEQLVVEAFRRLEIPLASTELEYLDARTQTVQRAPLVNFGLPNP